MSVCLHLLHSISTLMYPFTSAYTHNDLYCRYKVYFWMLLLFFVFYCLLCICLCYFGVVAFIATTHIHTHIDPLKGLVTVAFVCLTLYVFVFKRVGMQMILVAVFCSALCKGCQMLAFEEKWVLNTLLSVEIKCYLNKHTVEMWLFELKLNKTSF